MLIGNKKNFAIELEIVDFIDGWVFGSFIFWVNEKVIGNPDDRSVDLKACVSWLREFLQNQRNRFESGLFELDKEQVYVQLCSSVLAGEENLFSEERYEDTFYRFHVSHIGMSSFDEVTIILVENEKGDFRCIWKQGANGIEDAFLGKDEMRKVVDDAVLYFDKNSV